jgi:uncharacterized protein with HEPN domain
MDARDREYLGQMAAHARLALAWAEANPGWHVACDDSDRTSEQALVCYGIAHAVEQVGELGEDLISDGLKAAHPEIAWRAMGGMRHVISHDFSKPTFDYDIMAETVRTDLRPLVDQLEAVLAAPEAT